MLGGLIDKDEVKRMVITEMATDSQACKDLAFILAPYVRAEIKRLENAETHRGQRT